MLIANLLCIVIFGVVFVIGQSLTDVNDDDGTRIVGGEMVLNRSDFAFQVSVRNSSRNRHFCGGTIISDRVVLCAAHCFTNRDTSPGAIAVVAGDLYIFEETNDTVVRYNNNVIVHEEYNETSHENDVALIILQDGFNWSVNIFPTEPAMVSPDPGTNCTISGWGSLYSGGFTVDELMYAYLPIVGTEECATNYGPNRILPGMICAGFMDEGGVDTCQGDSGGPLMCDDSVAGIVSWGRGCALPGYPGIYTDVAYFYDWIDNTITDYFANEILGTTASPNTIYTTASPPNINTTPPPGDNTNPPISTESPPATTNAPPPGNSSVSYVGSLQLLVAIFLFNCILA